MQAALLFLTVVFALGALAYPPPSAEDRIPNKLTYHDFFEFDILLGPGQLDALRNGLRPDVDQQWMWPKVNEVVTVPYALDTVYGSFDSADKAKLEAAMAEYFTATGGCIKFVERTTETAYIMMSNPTDGGCYSYLGNQNKQQWMNLPNWCLGDHGSILHEMLHALGFAHEQNRVDRDEYVIIHIDNVQDQYKGQFNIATDTTAYGLPYDYSSVLHYSGTAGAIDYSKYVIETKDTKMQDVIGVYTNLSPIDVKKLKTLYTCTGSSDLDINGSPPSGDGPIHKVDPPIAYGAHGHNLP